MTPRQPSHPSLDSIFESDYIAPVIPLRDNIPTRSFAWMTLLLILGNGAAFFYEIQLGQQGDLEPCLQEHSLVASRFFERGWQAEWPTLLTSMFLHGGWLHLGGNMLYLWIFGNNIEDKIGKIRFILFYLLCGGAAAAAQLWLDPHATVPMLGASGAISGVLGAYLLLFPKARILTLVPFVVMWAVQIPAFFFLFFWIGIQLLNGLPMLWIPQWQEQAGVAWWAHIGGFVAGLVLIPFFRIGRKY